MAISRASDSSIQDGLPKYNDIWDGTTATSAFDSLGSVVLSATTASVTFSSIPQTYQHLQIRGIARNNSATTQTSLVVRLNGDAVASNYRPRHLLTGDGSSIAYYSDGAGTYTGLMLGSVYGGSNTANHFAPNIIDILDYTSTSKLTSAKCSAGSEMNGTTTSYVSFATGLWLNTAAVTSITLLAYDGSSLVANSAFALYGVK